eukprot:403353209
MLLQFKFKPQFKSQFKLLCIPNFATQLYEPTDPAGINYLKVEVGDYAIQQRTFTDQDLKYFSEAIQDKYAAYKNPSENSHTFYRSDIVYGIFTSAMFTSIFRLIFPKGIYMHQEVGFKRPVLRDEQVTGKVEITGWNSTKKDVYFRTTISKIDKETGKEIICVEGKATLEFHIQKSLMNKRKSENNRIIAFVLCQQT